MADTCPTCGSAWPAGARVGALLDEGLDTAEVAAALGMSERWVQKVRLAIGRPAPRGQGHRKKPRPAPPP